ncbi:hypothetical protein GDO86_012955 [Hymenochirus boettgeri]|uniref:DNA fragmentation factor 45kDa middle domain-containing protein n=1 Tax=Hymenochirus boettgeri TaxID=247094 RepID=A0A8T2IUU7_9PIPI|nr:hypothetical protein GDO86_012955 [Hymenochirus boettgeri]
MVDGKDLKKWRHLALHLKENLSNIILMSESDLEELSEVSVNELAAEIGVSCEKAQALQEAIQNVLDRREEERESKQLLELYIETVKKDVTSEAGTIEFNGDEVDTGRNSRTDLSC